MNNITDTKAPRDHLPEWALTRPFIDIMNKVGRDNFMRTVIYFSKKHGLKAALKAAIVVGFDIYTEEGKGEYFSNLLDKIAKNES